MNEDNNINHTSILYKTKVGFNRLTKIGKIVVISFLLITLFLSLYGFINYMRRVNTYRILLNGNKVITLYEGGNYKDEGVIAYNYKNKDVTKKVKIVDNIDYDKVGTYEIKYYVNSLWKRNAIKRTINIVGNPIDDIDFILNGKEDIVLSLGKKYEEQGYKLISEDGKDYSEFVSVISNVNDSKVGEYEVKYIFKINKREKELVRNVYITGDRYTLSYDEKLTNSDLKIKVLSNINDFSYFVAGNRKIYKDIANFVIKDNGTYSLKMVSKSGREDTINFEITNIDREAPTGTCVAYMYTKDNKTELNVSANDNNSVIYLEYNDETFEGNAYTYEEIVSEGIVYAYDEAGNAGKINCTYYYAPVMSGESSDIVKEFDGDSLKYWVEKFSTYYVTHIWVSDPYNQFKVAIKEPFPTLATATNIMNYEINAYEYKDKALIGANGSGFVSDVFNVSVGLVMPEWKYSSKSSVVIVNGEIKRNFTSINIPKMGAMTYGLKSNGYFDCYNLNHYQDITSNVINFDRLMNDGVKYTFAFSPVLVRKGTITQGLSYIRDIRQAIGQIDKNNFVIVTNTTTDRSLGFSHYSLARLMHDNLGCIEAYNTDGGGSTNLLYKDRETSNSKSLVYTYRSIPDVIYFVEK